MRLMRSGWAAVGAAVAISLGVGGLTLVSATSPEGAVAFVPVDPCRAADTRPGADNVGDRATPLGAAEAHTINANDGDCDGVVPASATGLQLNVTALGATVASFLTVWAEGDRPLASSLNPTPGQPPVPNAVTTAITGAGDFSIYNNAGSVDVVVDVVGFYTDHDHDDRYYPRTDIDRIIADATAPDPWRVDIDQTDLVTDDTVPAIIRGTGFPQSLWGPALLNFDSTDRWYGWTLPPAYEAGSDVRLSIHWLPENTGGNPSPCDYEVELMLLQASRPGAVPTNPTASWEDGGSIADPHLLAHPGQDSGEIPVQSASVLIDGTELGPGESFIVQLFRHADSADDTCPGPLYLPGATVTAAD